MRVLAMGLVGLLMPVLGLADLAEIRMEKRFGVGLGAAGPLSVLGVEGDVNLTEVFSVAGGIGTGLDYSTFMAKGRYFLLGKSVTPYFGAGIARWWTMGTKETKLKPSVLANKFLSPADDPSQGFSIFLFYPLVGVQFLHPSGFSVSAELQYLFKLMNFANGTYAGLGVHWYF